MKTLTELSGSLIRMAATAVAEARRTLAPEAPAAPERPPVQAVVVRGPGEAAPAPESAPADAPAAEVTPAVEAANAAAQPEAEPEEAEPAGESEAVKAALDEAVAKATGLSGDRLALLRAAVEIVGRRAADVRQVRVFGADEPVPGATTAGGHQYLVDLFPQSMRQTAGGREERGRGRGGRGGGRGGGGGGKGAPASGGFSMDALREDRKKEGRGRPGFGGRRPGGGRGPGGGGRGGGSPPGGAPKP